MKSKIFTVLLIVFTIVISIASILSIDVSDDIKNGQRHNSDEYVLNLDYKDDFRILQLCDIHLGTKDNVQEHLDFISITINEANADLIVLDGDNFTYADKTTAKRLFDFLDSFGVPWTLTLGNHDEQCAFSIDWMTDYLNNYGSNCKFIDIKGDDGRRRHLRHAPQERGHQASGRDRQAREVPRRRQGHEEAPRRSVRC